ncbi:glycosyltransferase [Afipia birgiae]|uniref:glycosyltransferase n=1 Tax=Afipia birgiae TaxID=151414 RepID=UPI000309F556|nr:glycosyltransferase [Afipia birgiae]
MLFACSFGTLNLLCSKHNVVEGCGLIPHLSVLMPVHNGDHWLVEAIESVLAQTYRDFEFIIVDDGSDDRSPEIIREFSAKDARIVPIFQPRAGLVAALNNGLHAARAALVARLDSDDVAEPTRFARQVAFMDQRPDVAVLGTWANAIDADGNQIGVRRPEANPVRLKAVLATGNPLIHSSVVFRKRFALDLGGYRAPFAAAEDYDLWLRMAERGAIAILPQKLIRYRVHSESVTSQKALQQLFSTRIAQKSAAIRRCSGKDPADEMPGPPDLWSGDSGPYGDEIRVFRILAWAEPLHIPALQRNQAPDIAVLDQFNLNRREQKIAQQAMAQLMKYHPDTYNVSTWWRLIKLRPFRATVFIYRHLKSKRQSKKG